MVQAHLHTKTLNHKTTPGTPGPGLPSRSPCGRLFLCPLRIERLQGDRRKLTRLRHIRASRIPGHYGPREHLTLAVRALHVRIHTFTLKFLQGHT